MEVQEENAVFNPIFWVQSDINLIGCGGENGKTENAAKEISELEDS